MDLNLLTGAGVRFALARARVRLHAKRHISAMLRVRNEEEFLAAAVASIADHVSELVIVDNLSTDGTPALIDSLKQRYRSKVRRFAYPWAIRKVGREHWELASTPSGAASPHLSSSFYNWSLRRCRYPWVLKWDGDMIATPAFGDAVERWRSAPQPVLVFNGENVHPDRRHLVRAREGDRETLLRRLSVPGLPMWVTRLTRDAPEPRLFPRFAARYDDALGWTQRLDTPFEHRAFRRRARLVVDTPCFLHMKFCKRDALANYSDDLRAVIEGNIAEGDPLPAGATDLLRHFGVLGAAASVPGADAASPPRPPA
jgi:hypothetical protein